MPIAYACTFLNPSNSSILRLAMGPPDADRDCILRATCYVLRAMCYVLFVIYFVVGAMCYIVQEKRTRERKKGRKCPLLSPGVQLLLNMIFS